MSSLALSRQNDEQSRKQAWERRKSSTRRAKMGFTRLVKANLGKPMHPVLASFTYAENIGDINRGRRDFTKFARRATKLFGNDFSYIAVPEFQKRGAIHFHALLWGIPTEVVERERATRLVASLWEQGFVDLMLTDGDEKLCGYLVKYMGKAFNDIRLFGKKAYVHSRNVSKPLTYKNTMAISHIYENDLSTTEPIVSKEFLTQWLGAGNYALYELIQSNDSI